MFLWVMGEGSLYKRYYSFVCVSKQNVSFDEALDSSVHMLPFSRNFNDQSWSYGWGCCQYTSNGRERLKRSWSGLFGVYLEKHLLGLFTFSS